ncbi:MAG: 4'-phosphopantetheinyl transferase superfamily protein [Acidobacteriaceae bacterium]|nr:4'-phosphopantetheinyl transferase superfamily protein [Acidobacteriaceae bacterium]
MPLLSPEERERAGRFHFEHLRTSYIAAHGAVRILLERYSGIPAAEIQYRFGPKGKPSIWPAGSLEFNLSHSGFVMLVAVAFGCQLGVDLEQVRPVPELRDIARRFFCEEEVAELETLPVDEQERAFFICWTQKEAYLKATGEGLSAPLDSFRVPLGRAKADLRVHGCTLLQLRSPEMPAGYVGAVAYTGHARPVCVMRCIDCADLLG